MVDTSRYTIDSVLLTL
jgi:hypothetical protein